MITKPVSTSWEKVSVFFEEGRARIKSADVRQCTSEFKRMGTDMTGNYDEIYEYEMKWFQA